VTCDHKPLAVARAVAGSERWRHATHGLALETPQERRVRKPLFTRTCVMKLGIALISPHELGAHLVTLC
jgi:hypothetical protein